MFGNRLFLHQLAEKLCFFPPKKLRRSNLYHEGYHAQQWLDIGSENYQSLTRLQREEYVFDEIMKSKHLFDEASIQHSINYIERLRGGR
ncbi:zincin-like metallopeptidase toxin domain-containing protein [Streptococcus suis]